MQKLFDEIENIAENDVGLIISGYTYPSHSGRRRLRQLALTEKSQVNHWINPLKKVHANGCKFFFQLSHAGLAKFPSARYPGEIVAGASEYGPDSRPMTNQEIEEAICDFTRAAKLAQLTGADGIQLDCAHGNLLSQFLSPALNRRSDKWGGTDINRFRIVNEIIDSIKKEVNSNFAIAVKINGNDCIDGGVTPYLCSKYISMMPDVHMFEISCGVYNQMVTIRSNPFEKSLFRKASEKEKIKVLKQVAKAVPAYGYTDGYNNDAVHSIRQLVGPEPTLSVVGGLRKFSMMEDLVKSDTTNFVSLCRPLIRQPKLITEFKKGTTDHSKCINCGECSLRHPTAAVECTWPITK
jgi:2,4-dienoyl-CoA reductase-like NADH-dependent reductase (Old Yellow Enzyme family)